MSKKLNQFMDRVSDICAEMDRNISHIEKMILPYKESIRELKDRCLILEHRQKTNPKYDIGKQYGDYFVTDINYFVSHCSCQPEVRINYHIFNKSNNENKVIEEQEMINYFTNYTK